MRKINLVVAVLALALLVGMSVAASAENVALGKSYKHLMAPDSQSYSDFDNAELTDNSFLYSWSDMIGFPGQPATEEGKAPLVASFVIDLEKVYGNINRVGVMMMLSTSSAVKLPERIEVLGSVDGENFAAIGEATETDPNPVAEESLITVFWQGDAVKARYVKVNLYSTAGWTMVCEAMVETP